MKAGQPKLETHEPAQEASQGGALARDITRADGVDLSLLEDSLAKTIWERMLANDDALRFADSLRAALEKRNAKSQRTDAETH